MSQAIKQRPPKQTPLNRPQTVQKPPQATNQPKSNLPKPTTAQKSLLSSVKEWTYKKAFGQPVPPITVQDTIPYIAMFEDGICHVSEGYYTKTIAFTDTNYTMLDESGKQGLYAKWLSIFNSLNEKATLQLTYMNTEIDLHDINAMLSSHRVKEGASDQFTAIGQEFYDMLKSKLSSAKKGLMRRRYATIGIHVMPREKLGKNGAITDESISEARSRLLTMEKSFVEILGGFGSSAFPLNGRERLELLHRQMHPNPRQGFAMGNAFPTDVGVVNYNDFPIARTKDYISPKAMVFDKNRFTLNYALTPSKPSHRPTFGSMSYIEIESEQLPDVFLSRMLDTDYPMTVNLHIHPISKDKAIKYAKAKLSAIDIARVDRNKKSFRDNVDPNIMPPDMLKFSEEAKELQMELQGGQELFDTYFTVTHYANNPQDLESRMQATGGVVSQYSCKLRPLSNMQEQAFTSSLALGSYKIPKVAALRKLYTSALAVLMPFTTKEICEKDPQAIYYGTNAISGVVVLANRKKLKNPNGVVLGKPGSGKSFLVKCEIINVMRLTSDTVLILDPESEYPPLVKALGGVVIKLSTSSPTNINPLDIVWDYGTDEEPNDPLGLKSGFVMSMMETIISRELSAIEKSILDRCVRRIYEIHEVDPKPENMPILLDLYNALLTDFDPNDPNNHTVNSSARLLAHALDMYVNGSYTMFSRRTNIDISNRLICFDTKSLSKEMRALAMLIIQDQIWAKVSHNRTIKKGTWTYIDEFHLLLKHRQTTEYSVEMYKRFRKWHAVPTVITQIVKDFLRNSEAEDIFEVAEFIVLLDQDAGNGRVLQERLKLSDSQLSHITNAQPGDALVRFGASIIAVKDDFPKDTLSYGLITTRPSDSTDNNPINEKIKRSVENE